MWVMMRVSGLCIKRSLAVSKYFFSSSRRRHTRFACAWSSDVCSSDLFEVKDLEAAGIRVIQIDEPALREGLPLKRAEWPAYLEWAVKIGRASCREKCRCRWSPYH